MYYSTNRGRIGIGTGAKEEILAAGAKIRVGIDKFLLYWLFCLCAKDLVSIQDFWLITGYNNNTSKLDPKLKAKCAVKYLYGEN